MLELKTTKRYEKDYAMQLKRGKDISKLIEIIKTLVTEKSLDKKYKDHTLCGNYVGHRECHIEPDWLLIYKKTATELILVRTGSHSNLF